MLFDEKELNVFDNNEARTYFKEILQSYYSQNYRATVVLLYSFVIYDLFIKLQTMANEGDKKASTKLTEINTMINYMAIRDLTDDKRIDSSWLRDAHSATVLNDDAEVKGQLIVESIDKTIDTSFIFSSFDDICSINNL